jgi:riboflavin kinase / FMN adenylyltransferase
MKVFRSAAEIHAENNADFGPSVVAIGNFDGVHAGHRQIMRRVVAIARERGYTPTILTFDPHPAQVLAPDRAPKLLMTIDQRVRAMQSEGIEAVLLFPFSLDFAKLRPGEFASIILAKALRARVILVGDDFRFGYKQSGDVDTLRTYGQTLGFELEAIAGIGRRGKRISSSEIRNLVTAGAVSRACRLLDTPFALEGKVVPGHGVGSKQTVPTLNLDPFNEVLPKTGVYATRTRDLDSSRTWNSITNIGYRPTFDGHNLTIETFLLYPLDDPAPVHIEVGFLKYLRDEKKFENPAALKSQILKDVNVATRLHRRLAKSGVGYPFN